ncbi:MAG TPA: chemotaxis protein CheW [Candidatus Sulfotelmatobacter sp.]|nr:chemotaxis protein CheW [Candidatus Sulfotelmatobacter sp.]
MASQQFCTFLLDGYLFGVPVPQVQEVIRFHEMTPVPLAPPAVEGLINLRGQIVLAIDLRRRLGLPRRTEGTLPINVVMRTPDGAVSLLVDEIGEVIEVSDSNFEAPPDTLRGEIRSLILGVYKLEGNLLHALDSGNACQVPVAAEATAAER